MPSAIRGVGKETVLRRVRRDWSSQAPHEFVNKPGILSRIELYLRDRGNDRE